MLSALIPSQSGPVFSQQGTVDWTQLAKSSVALSLEILSRLSQAGVEPLNLAVGQEIFSRFLLHPSTQQKIQTSLEGLKPLSSYGNILWFGFGIKHVVRLLVESEQGTTCVALCGALSASYDKFYCAQVLRSTAKIQATPGHLSPSITQWSNLVDTCSGTLLSSDFPNLVEGFTRLWYNGAAQDVWKRRGATSPQALGEALSTLAAVSSDCAWVGAVAEWVLCLRVEVRDASTGDYLYLKHGESDHTAAQVKILRTFDTQSSMVRVRDTTCFLASGNEIFHMDPEMGDKFFAGGRSTWDSILSDTFSVQSLSILASAEVGSAFAYVLRKVADQIHLRLGADKNVLEILPELKPILSHVRFNVDTFEGAEEVVRSACGCPCFTITQYLWILARVHLHPSIQPSSFGLRNLYFLLLGQHVITEGARSAGAFCHPSVEAMSPNHKNNILPTILHTFTGIPVQEEPTLDASAISESGIVICCSSLLNPSLPPRGTEVFHIVPGHIQKDDSLFWEVYDLDAKLGMRLEEETIIKYRFDDKLRLIMSMHDNKSPPELLVRETVQGRKLQANYSWQYQLFNDTSPGNSIAGAAPASSPKMLITAYGSAGLQSLLWHGVSLPICEYKHIAHIMALNHAFSGTCCKVFEDITLHMQSPASSHFPRPGEWVLLDVGTQKQPGKYGGEEFPTKIYRGSLVKLYSLLCNSEPGKHLKLVRASNCIFCTCLWQSRTIIIVSGQSSPTETIFADGITVLTPEINPSTNSIPDPGSPSGTAEAPSPTPPPPPLPETKTNKRKSTRATKGNRKRKTSTR
ncbi:hypothetical protein BJY00DRAFT_297681 [Aspergillus carlsbadensis]|nr:hypothetical protein BJY00DRAFT_297681 [Aspergillus carlsbadensis]